MSRSAPGWSFFGRLSEFSSHFFPKNDRLGDGPGGDGPGGYGPGGDGPGYGSGEGSPECPVGPPGTAPAIDIQGIARINEGCLTGDSRDLGRIQFVVVAPLGEQQDDICVACCIKGGCGVGQIGEELTRIVHGPRIVHNNVGAGLTQSRGDMQCWGVAHVVTVGLERRAPCGDAATMDASVEGFDREVDGVLTAPDVDVVNIAQKHQCLIDAELTRSRHEGPNVLG